MQSSEEDVYTDHGKRQSRPLHTDLPRLTQALGTLTILLATLRHVFMGLKHDHVFGLVRNKAFQLRAFRTSEHFRHREPRGTWPPTSSRPPTPWATTPRSSALVSSSPTWQPTALQLSCFVSAASFCCRPDAQNPSRSFDSFPLPVSLIQDNLVQVPLRGHQRPCSNRSRNIRRPFRPHDPYEAGHHPNNITDPNPGYAGREPLHSPLFRQSLLVSFHPLTDILKFSSIPT